MLLNSFFDLSLEATALNHVNLDEPPTGLIWTADQLETLIIATNIYSGGIDILPWLQQELGHRTSPYKQLSTIAITLYIFNQLQWSMFLPKAVDEDWRPFGESLANSTIFPSLQSVSLHIFSPKWVLPGGDLAQRVVDQKAEQIRKAMSLLETRGIFSLQMSIEVA
jgi:hypothetical protein